MEKRIILGPPSLLQAPSLTGIARQLQHGGLHLLVDNDAILEADKGGGHVLVRIQAQGLHLRLVLGGKYKVPMDQKPQHGR